MITSATKLQVNSRPKHIKSSVHDKMCGHCGGNGYQKTTPNCYHTCLECLGRGFLPSN